MPTVSLVLAGLAAATHLFFFFLESIAFRKPFAHRTFGVRDPAEVEVLAFAMLNQGFYNLFLAIGTFAGVVGSARGWEPQGSTLVVFGCLFMLGAAVVLVVSRPALWRGALVQGLLPLLALLTAWLV